MTLPLYSYRCVILRYCGRRRGDCHAIFDVTFSQALCGVFLRGWSWKSALVTSQAHCCPFSIGCQPELTLYWVLWTEISVAWLKYLVASVPSHIVTRRLCFLSQIKHGPIISLTIKASTQLHVVFSAFSLWNEDICRPSLIVCEDIWLLPINSRLPDLCTSCFEWERHTFYCWSNVICFAPD